MSCQQEWTLGGLVSFPREPCVSLRGEGYPVLTTRPASRCPGVTLASLSEVGARQPRTRRCREAVLRAWAPRDEEGVGMDASL